MRKGRLEHMELVMAAKPRPDSGGRTGGGPGPERRAMAGSILQPGPGATRIALRASESVGSRSCGAELSEDVRMANDSNGDT